MKTDTKKQDGEPVNPLFTSKSQQILCEASSPGFAVQGTPDFQNHSDSLLSGQGEVSDSQNQPIYCAKPWRIWTQADKDRLRDAIAPLLHLTNATIGSRLCMTAKAIGRWMPKLRLRRTPEQIAALMSSPGEINPRWKNGIAKNHYHWKKLQRQRYPERVNARQAVHRAVKLGRLIPLPCQHPGCAETKTCAHHEDYSKPLDVVWFCKPHHDTADRERRASLNFPTGSTLIKTERPHEHYS